MFKHNEQQPEGFQASLKEALDNLAFNDAGLVAAIAQQHDLSLIHISEPTRPH